MQWDLNIAPRNRKYLNLDGFYGARFLYFVNLSIFGLCFIYIRCRLLFSVHAAAIIYVIRPQIGVFHRTAADAGKSFLIEAVCLTCHCSMFGYFAYRSFVPGTVIDLPATTPDRYAQFFRGALAVSREFGAFPPSPLSFWSESLEPMVGARNLSFVGAQSSSRGRATIVSRGASPAAAGSERTRRRRGGGRGGASAENRGPGAEQRLQVSSSTRRGVAWRRARPSSRTRPPASALPRRRPLLPLSPSPPGFRAGPQLRPPPPLHHTYPNVQLQRRRC